MDVGFRVHGSEHITYQQANKPKHNTSKCTYVPIGSPNIGKVMSFINPDVSSCSVASESSSRGALLNTV